MRFVAIALGRSAKEAALPTSLCDKKPKIGCPVGLL